MPSDKSPLARAQSGSAGRAANSTIAQSVIDRIVADSTPQFQEFLARSGNGNAGAAAAQLVAAAPAMPLQAVAPMPPALNPSYMPPPPSLAAGMPAPPMLGMGGVASVDPREQLLRSLGLI